jgi:hypothetical protein
MQVVELNNLRVLRCGIKKESELTSLMILTNTQWCNNYNIKIKKPICDQRKAVLYSFYKEEYRHLLKHKKRFQ